jgi:hypothetical protein
LPERLYARSVSGCQTAPQKTNPANFRWLLRLGWLTGSEKEDRE